jgi:hypothetical protein
LLTTFEHIAKYTGDNSFHFCAAKELWGAHMTRDLLSRIGAAFFLAFMFAALLEAYE